MKKLFFFMALIVLAVASCKEKKPASFTRLGDFTPYQTYMEKLNGKVETVAEKGYWAVPEGDALIKGARITKKELDSLGYTYEYKAIFDIDGDLVSCSTNDENENIIDKWSFSKENNMLARAEFTSNDTLIRYKLKITLDESDNPVLYEVFNAVSDTLIQKIEIKGSEINDTMIVQYYNFKGEPDGKNLSVYNELGLLTNFENFMKDGTPGSSYNLIYNDKGFQTETTFFDKDKKKENSTSTVYEYDDMGNWIKSTWKDDRGFAIICERVYTYFE